MALTPQSAAFYDRAMKRVLLVIALPVVALVGGSLLLPNRVFYRDRRPTPVGRFVNAFWSRIYGLGLFPPLLASLEVPGRTSGKVHTVPVVVARHNGDRYLVSMLGEHSAWVRNVRAANGRAVLRHGKAEQVRLVDVPVDARAPIIKSYVAVAPGARPHIQIPPDAPVAAFEQAAQLCPVFRIEPATDAR